MRRIRGDGIRTCIVLFTFISNRHYLIVYYYYAANVPRRTLVRTFTLTLASVDLVNLGGLGDVRRSDMDACSDLIKRPVSSVSGIVKNQLSYMHEDKQTSEQGSGAPRAATGLPHEQAPHSAL